MTRLRRAFHTLRAKRDWLLGKIEYLQAESARWRTLFNLAKSPYSLLRGLGLSPQVIAALFFAGAGAGGGYIANEALADRSFSRGDPGVYAAPGDIPVHYDRDDNTLRVDLGTTPVGEITIENITVGSVIAGSTLPSGETNAVFVGGLPEDVGAGFVETFLEVGHLKINRWRCTQLTLDNIEVHELIVEGNASDGQSIAPVAGTPRDRAIGGGNRADSMTTSGGFYDQLKIQAPTSGLNGKVDVLTLSNLYTKGGPCVISRIKAGTITISLNEIGAGDGFAAKDFVIAASVSYKTFTNNENVEVVISPP